MTVTTVILAGGKGSRIGGDKGLRLLHGRPLIAWVLDVIQAQSGEVLLSANGEEYSNFDCPVIFDQPSGWAGPLAGLQSALSRAQYDWVASVPCDTPFLPKDLIEKLLAAAGSTEAAVAVVKGRRQPVIALYRKNVLAKLDAYLAAGERKVGDWLDSLQINEVVFDDAEAFININTQEELEAVNSKLFPLIKDEVVTSIHP